MLRSLIEIVGDLPPAVLVALAAALAFGETAILLDLIVPGEAGIVVMGAASAAAGVPMLLVAAAAAVGSALGDTVSFLIGRHLGASASARRWTARPRVAAALDRAHRHFERHGGATIFVGRWIGALRAVVPFVAGGSGLRFRVFVAWNAAASATWATAMVAIGHRYGLGVADGIDRAERWVTGAIVLALVIVVLLVRCGRRAQMCADVTHPSP